MRKLIFLIIFILSGIFIFAQNSNKIKRLEKQRKQILLEISNTDELLKNMKRNTSSLLDRIKLITNQINSRKQVINLLTQELQAIEIEETNIKQEIANLEINLKEKQSSYVKAVEALLKNRNSKNKLLFVLSGKSLSESFMRMRYLREYSEARSRQADEITERKLELKEKRESLKKTKTEKMALLKSRQIEQGNLKQEEASQQVGLKKAQEKQQELQTILSQKKKLATKLNSQIEKLIADDIARQEREAKRKFAESKKAGNNVEANAGAKMTAEDVKLAGSFEANKGKLPMPVSGSYVITTRFGKHHSRQWKAVETTSNGIDIQGSSGSYAKAVFDGEVTLIAAFAGYNNCIIIRHGSYYTFYGNIHSLNIKKGDKVKTNQKLGLLYTDTDTGKAELHFQLWKGTNKQNPEPWLRK